MNMYKSDFVAKTLSVFFAFFVFMPAIALAFEDAPAFQEINKEDPQYVEYLKQARQALRNKNPKRAIENYLNPIMGYCDKKIEDSPQKVYSARSMEEALFFLMKDMKKNITEGIQDEVVVIGPLCAEAIYLQGFARIELGEQEAGKKYIEKALELAPINALYLCELGHIYQSEKRWEEALALYTKAEEYAKDFAPEAKKKTELARAKRGMGFSLIELGRLDEAEEKYRECLRINSQDQVSQSELGYILQLKKQRR